MKKEAIEKIINHLDKEFDSIEIYDKEKVLLTINNYNLEEIIFYKHSNLLEIVVKSGTITSYYIDIDSITLIKVWRDL